MTKIKRQLMAEEIRNKNKTYYMDFCDCLKIKNLPTDNVITHICTIRAIQLSMYINHMVIESSDTGWSSYCIYLPLNVCQLSRTLNEST